MTGVADSSAAYDPVAPLYDRAFADIRVRRAEWRWVQRRVAALPLRPRLLELGCGTGALLRALAPQLERGLGIDVAGEMLRIAQRRAQGFPNLHFAQAGGRLPLRDRSVDVVISFLSFRYLDWPGVWPEVRRVLAPGGRFWLVDLVAERATPGDVGRLAHAGLRNLLAPLRHPGFARALRELTQHPAWRAMLERHPIRALAAYRAFFAVALPGREFEVLDVAPGRRVVALDSGSLT